MRTITLLVAIFLTLSFTSCSLYKADDVAAFEFNGAWYWIAEYEGEFNKEDVKEYIKYAEVPKTTNYYFFYDKERINVSLFAEDRFNKLSLFRTLSKYPPDYSYFKMSTDKILQEDAMFMIDMVVDENN